MNKPSVLIVDDSEELLHGLALVMRHAGYHVWTAINGHAALDMIQEHVPDVIICDVMMPYPDGFELRNILSRDEKLSGIPFIFLTAMGTQTGKLQGLAAGADDYITKPFDNRELILRVQSVLRRVDVSRQQALLEVEEQMNMLRHEVVKNMTHEMRTPLAQILSTLELAITNRFIDPQAQKDFVQSALSNARVLQNLVEDFLLLVNIEQGEVSSYRQEIRQNFDFRQPIERLQQRYENKQLQVRVQVQETETIYAPRREFRRIIEHMVDNALKFSHEGGRVSVWLRAIGQGGCVCSVRDEGPGIPLDLQEKVFEQYYQISQGHAREYGGLGLGLYIARQLARTWGGDVRIVDMEKGGCHVQLMIPPLVTLPLQDEP